MTLSAYGLFAWCRQGSTNALTYGTPKTFEATGAGAAGGTTIVCTTLDDYEETTRSNFVGWWIEVVRCANGPAGERGAPLRRRVLGYVDATDTLTIEALPWATADGDKFNFLKPWNAWVATDDPYLTTAAVLGGTVSTATNHINSFYTSHSTEAEAGGPYATAVYSGTVTSTTNVSVGVMSTVTYSATAWYGFSCTLNAAPAEHELFELWEYPEVFSGLPVPVTQERLDRKPITGVQAPLRGAAGLRDGGGAIDLAFHGPGVGREGDHTEWDVPMGAIMDAEAIVDDAVATYTTGLTQVIFSTAPAAGEIFATEAGDVFVVSALSGATATPSPSVRYAPAQSTVLYGMRKYTESTLLNYAIACQQWHGKGVREYLFGCVPAITFSGARGEFLKCSVDLKVADFTRVNKGPTNAALARQFNAKPSTITPRKLGNTRINLGGTEFEARAFTIDTGADIQPKINLSAPNGTDGSRMVKMEPAWTADLYLDTDSKSMLDQYLYGNPITVLIQAGDSVGEPGIFAFWAYECELTATEMGEENGFIAVQLQGRVTYDSTTTLDTWMFGTG